MRLVYTPVTILLALATYSGTATRAQGAIVPGSQWRLVQVESGASDLRLNPSSASDGPLTVQRLGGDNYGLFQETVEAFASLGGSSAYAMSAQQSEVTSTSIVAIGSLSASASTSAPPGWGGGTASMWGVFEFDFSVDTPDLYSLKTGLSHAVSGEVSYSIFPSRILFEDNSGTILLRWLENPGDQSEILVTLEPGGSYHLLAEFLLGGTLSPDDDNGASFAETASYSVVLEVVPEPATLSLLALGVLALVRRRGTGSASGERFRP